MAGVLVRSLDTGGMGPDDDTDFQEHELGM